ncbi:MAG TPA: tetratricopeptide repeat protein [Lutibacter sp.]|nr:tetratricopeptide repeat protein [Lutibacter sp.]
MKHSLSILFLIFSISLIAQNRVSILIDSLTIVSESSEKSRLGQDIAWELKNTDWTRTLHYLDYSEIEAKASKLDDVLAKYYSKAADIYYEKEAFDIALAYYQKAYNIYTLNSNSVNIKKLENDLAIIYARMNNKDRALYFFKKVYNYQKKQKDSTHLAHTLNNIGTLYLEKKIDSSEIYYLKSLEIAKKINNKELYAFLYTNLGRVYNKKEDFVKAKTYINKSIASTKTDIKDDTRSWVFESASKYYLHTNQNDSAIYFAKKAVALLIQHKYSFKNKDAIYSLYKGYLANKEYKNASEYFELYNLIRDSLNIEEKAVNIERLKLEQEFHSKNKIRLLKEKQKKTWYFIIALSLVSGLLFVLILLKRSKNKLIQADLEKQINQAKRKELRAKLELKNNELVAKTMTEIHRTEIVQNILLDLKKIKLKAVKKETQNAIDYILKRLEKDTNTNIWKEFELSFEQVHKSFYNKLTVSHPNLTSNDRRLCALLLLNLTSKEISQITGQSFKSVENARTRLRKKLNLTNSSTNLATYLNSFNVKYKRSSGF